MAFETIKTINETKQVQFLSFYLNSGLSEVRYSDHPLFRGPVPITYRARYWNFIEIRGEKEKTLFFKYRRLLLNAG